MRYETLEQNPDYEIKLIGPKDQLNNILVAKEK
jgi:hypothetical protein